MRISDQLLMDCGHQRLLTHIFVAMHWHCVWQRTNSGNHTDPYEFTEVLQSSTRLRLVATLAGKCCQTHRAIRHVSSFIFPAKWEKIDRLHWLHFFQFKTQRHVTCCAWLASHSRPLQRPLPVPECPTPPKWYWLWNRSEPLNPLLSGDMMHFRHKTTVLHSRSNAIAEKRNVLWGCKMVQHAVKTDISSPTPLMSKYVKVLLMAFKVGNSTWSKYTGSNRKKPSAPAVSTV